MLREKMSLLRKKFTDSAGTVELMLRKVNEALVTPREGFMEELSVLEAQVNHFELELDFFCTSIISLYAPEAKDLRTVLMILKMNGDVERMGDLLYGIAKVIRQLRESGEKADPELPSLLSAAGGMMREGIDAFLEEDVAKAEHILELDDVIDKRRHAIIKRMLDAIAKDPSKVQSYYADIKITQKIERLADHATNLAEDVIYMIRARSVKHHNQDDTPLVL